MVKEYTVMVKVYTIWAAYLKYGSIMKCVMLDDHLREINRLQKTINQLVGEERDLMITAIKAAEKERGKE